MPPAGHNSSGPASASGAATLPHPEAAYNVQPQAMELEQKLHQHETAGYAKDKHVSAAHRRELEKMHRFSVDNLIELKQDAYAKSKAPLELTNSFGKFVWPAFNCNESWWLGRFPKLPEEMHRFLQLQPRNIQNQKRFGLIGA